MVLSIFVGEKDELISLYSASRLEQIAASEDKKLISYPRGRHMLHVESDEIRDEFISDLATWVLERTPERPPEPAASPRKRRNKNVK